MYQFYSPSTNWTRAEKHCLGGSKAFLLFAPSLLGATPCLLCLDWLHSGLKCVAALLGLLPFISVLHWTVFLDFTVFFLPCSDGIFFAPRFWFSTIPGTPAFRILKQKLPSFPPPNFPPCTLAGSLDLAFSALLNQYSCTGHSVLQNVVDISLGGFWVYTIFVPYHHFSKSLGRKQRYIHLFSWLCLARSEQLNVYKQNCNVSHHVSCITYKGLQAVRAQEVFASNNGSEL